MFKMEIHTEITIQTSAEQLWKNLTNFADYPDWNPFILNASGKVETGEILTVFIQPPGSKGMTFKPILTKVEPLKELRWAGKFLLPGLLDAEHVFCIETMEENCVKFIHSEFFTGFLVPLFKKNLKTNSIMGFEAMNQSLKARLEQKES